jgi:TolB-like protein/Tfp pilus assembly protein PilF
MTPTVPTGDPTVVMRSDGQRCRDPLRRPERPAGPDAPAAVVQSPAKVPEMFGAPLLLARRRLILGGGALLCVAAVVGAGIVLSREMEGRRPATASIAVLPLENLSGDPAQDYFADGMTEALIGRLAQIRALRVVSRTSVMAFKDSRLPLREIARALDVNVIVHGSVQRVADRVRIGIRMIDPGTDAHLWARDYEREWKDILQLQAALAQAIGDEIRVHVTTEERARMALAAPVDSAAHQQYLMGRYYLWRDNEQDLRRAVTHFERATQIDRDYAAAYAALAHAWWKLGLWVETLAATEPAARAAARQALQLDDALPEAYVVQADIARLYDRDMVRAEQFVKQALALEPHNSDAHYTYALLLMTVGRMPEAIAHMESAEQLDPLSPAIHSDFGRVLYRAGRHEEAILRLTRSLELEPAMAWLVYPRLAEVYEQMGLYDRALAALRLGGGQGWAHEPQFARILARAGDRREAMRIVQDLEDSGQVRPYALAAAHVALGNHDRAFTLLFDFVERRDPGPNFVAVDPPFADLHGDPRWEDLLRRVNQAPR